jgi:hypothetical protein
MSEKRVLHLVHRMARDRAIEAVKTAPDGWSVTVRPPTRSLPQNARMWACLTDIAEQVKWHGRTLDTESWKAIFSSALKKLDVVPNLDGTGFVVLGMSTSRMSKQELSDLMELMTAFGNERGVQWSEQEIAA